MEHLGFKIEVEWLWSEDRQSRFEDSIMPHNLIIIGRVCQYYSCW